LGVIRRLELIENAFYLNDHFMVTMLHQRIKFQQNGAMHCRVTQRTLQARFREGARLSSHIVLERSRPYYTKFKENTDVDRVYERRLKAICPHHKNTLQYTNLL